MYHIHALVRAPSKSNKADFQRILSGEEPQHYADLGRRRGRAAPATAAAISKPGAL